MRKQLVAMLGLFDLLAAAPAIAQRGDRGHDFPRANQGQLPLPPEQRIDPQAPGDVRYRVERPFAHGRFVSVGPAHRFAVIRIDRDRHRFWFPGGFLFDVAVWDWPICADWCWDCGNDFVVYDDPDHIGWYLLYNVHTGVYVHVQYAGR